MNPRIVVAVLLLAAFSFCSAANWWIPPPRTTWNIQFAGPLDFTSYDVEVYYLDLYETNQSTIDYLHSQGKKVICYFSAGSYEDWRPDANQFPKWVIGKDLDGWPGEKWLDISNITALGPIMENRLDLAVSKSCDAVDPDNMDGFMNPTGFKLTNVDQLRYNQFIANQSHARNLSVGLKNDVSQIQVLVNYYDFAVNEECFDYKECAIYSLFIKANKAVFGLQYGKNPSTDDFCPKANAYNFTTLLKNLSLDAWQFSCLDHYGNNAKVVSTTAWEYTTDSTAADALSSASSTSTRTSTTRAATTSSGATTDNSGASQLSFVGSLLVLFLSLVFYV